MHRLEFFSSVIIRTSIRTCCWALETVSAGYLLLVPVLGLVLAFINIEQRPVLSAILGGPAFELPLICFSPSREAFRLGFIAVRVSTASSLGRRIVAAPPAIRSQLELQKRS